MSKVPAGAISTGRRNGCVKRAGILLVGMRDTDVSVSPIRSRGRATAAVPTTPILSRSRRESSMCVYSSPERHVSRSSPPDRRHSLGEGTGKNLGTHGPVADGSVGDEGGREARRQTCAACLVRGQRQL